MLFTTLNLDQRNRCPLWKQHSRWFIVFFDAWIVHCLASPYSSFPTFWLINSSSLNRRKSLDHSTVSHDYSPSCSAVFAIVFPQQCGLKCDSSEEHRLDCCTDRLCIPNSLHHFRGCLLYKKILTTGLHLSWLCRWVLVHNIWGHGHKLFLVLCCQAI